MSISLQFTTTHNFLDISASNRIKSHKPVISCSISRWIKETLSDAGVHTEMFKGHSTRAASTSATSVKGDSASDIMALAG